LKAPECQPLMNSIRMLPNCIVPPKYRKYDANRFGVSDDGGNPWRRSASQEEKALRCSFVDFTM
jgi:hypothetical protein